MIHPLPAFDEASEDIPPGYGIEHSHDGGWYPYQTRPFLYIKDARGLDLACDRREDALEALQVKAVQP